MNEPRTLESMLEFLGDIGRNTRQDGGYYLRTYPDHGLLTARASLLCVMYGNFTKDDIRVYIDKYSEDMSRDEIINTIQLFYGIPLNIDPELPLNVFNTFHTENKHSTASGKVIIVAPLAYNTSHLKLLRVSDIAKVGPENFETLIRGSILDVNMQDDPRDVFDETLI